MTNEIKEILETAINNDCDSLYFAPDSQGTYTITLWGTVWDVYAVTGQKLLDAIHANKDNYSFNCVTAPYVLYASPENPYITLMNNQQLRFYHAIRH